MILLSKFLPSHKNKLFKIIEDRGDLVISNFELREHGEGELYGMVIKYVETKFVFDIKIDHSEVNMIIYAPGQNDAVALVTNTRNEISWETIEEHFKIWLNCLAGEVLAEDLWKKK